MAGRVFFSVSMSLDGFVAPEPVTSVAPRDFFTPEKQGHPEVRRWMSQWMELQQWAFPLRFFRENLKLGEGDGLATALDQARAAAGARDVRIAGGGATILAYLNAGLIDEFSIALAPVLFGTGVRLFEGIDASRLALQPVRARPSPRVTHLTYVVRPRASARPTSDPAKG
jgi:hypothetical protein